MSSSKTLRFSSLLLFSSLAIGAPYADPASAASLYRVSQESAPERGDFDSNILGFIKPFVTTQTAVEYYQYGNPDRFSFNGIAPILQRDTSHLFLVDAYGGLSLFAVHGRPMDSSGGRVSMQFDLAGDTAAVLFQDDPTEFTSLFQEDNQLTINSAWGPCCTDGTIIGILEGRWSVLTSFESPSAVDMTRLTDWKAFSADDTHINLTFQAGQRVKIEPLAHSETSQVPEPSTILGVFLGSMISLARCRKKTSQVHLLS